MSVMDSIAPNQSVGHTHFPGASDSNDQRWSDPYGKAVKERIDANVATLLAEAAAAAGAFLDAHAGEVEKVALALMERESLGYADVKAILGPRPPRRSPEASQKEPDEAPSASSFCTPSPPKDARGGEGGAGGGGGGGSGTGGSATPPSGGRPGGEAGHGEHGRTGPHGGCPGGESGGPIGGGPSPGGIGGSGLGGAGGVPLGDGGGKPSPAGGPVVHSDGKRMSFSVSYERAM